MTEKRKLPYTVIPPVAWKEAKVVRFCTVFVLLFLTGCMQDKPRFTEEELAEMPLAQRTGLPEPSGGMVLSVAGETITAGEIINPIVDRLRPMAQQTSYAEFSRRLRGEFEQLVIDRISNILLWQKAKKELGIQAEDALEKAVETEVQKFIADFAGDYAKAEQQLQKMNMDWQSFREYQKKMILSQSYISSELPKPKPITYRQLKDVYDEMKDKAFTTEAKIQFRLIDIQPDKLKLSNPDQNRIGVAKGLAYEILTKLRNGEDFGELAKQYSDGYRAMFGGSWKPVQPSSLAEPYDILAANAEKMQPGQITPPIQVDGHIFIMKLEQKTAESVEPFENVQKQIESRIRFQRRMKAVNQISAKIAQQVSVQNKSEFIDFCLYKLYQICNQ